mmetsp:Transcript_42593/g.58176  ORF Transcript_42593/g.58176 Transcript_42593/m.58176 type:complete len:229 (-) Transcript_42593:162-848(-)
MVSAASASACSTRSRAAFSCPLTCSLACSLSVSFCWVSWTCCSRLVCPAVDSCTDTSSSFTDTSSASSVRTKARPSSVLLAAASADPASTAANLSVHSRSVFSLSPCIVSTVLTCFSTSSPWDATRAAISPSSFSLLSSTSRSVLLSFANSCLSSPTSSEFDTPASNATLTSSSRSRTFFSLAAVSPSNVRFAACFSMSSILSFMSLWFFSCSSLTLLARSSLPCPPA